MIKQRSAGLTSSPFSLSSLFFSQKCGRRVFKAPLSHAPRVIFADGPGPRATVRKPGPDKQEQWN